jgi:hypothetical protein
MSSRPWVLACWLPAQLAASACGGAVPAPAPAPSTPPGPAPALAAAPLDPISPQRVLRLAARCPTARGQAVPITWRRDATGGWTVRLRWPAPSSTGVEVHPRDVQALPPGAVTIDPKAGTCDGQLVDVAPAPGDVAFEAILARAERCTGEPIDRATVRVDSTVNAGRISVDPAPTTFHSLVVQIDTRTGACSVDRGGMGPGALTEVRGPAGFTPWLGL